MIVVNYGQDITKTTYEALAACDISSYLRLGMNVAIKPNLVVPGPASAGATTHPEVVEAIIYFLKDFGITNITIIESSWIGDCTKQAFKYCGYEELSQKHDVPLFDLKSDSYSTVKYGDTAISICNRALKTDFLINVPVLKAHSQTRLTCAMKNLKGCIPDSEKRRFHSIGLHKPIAELNMLLKTGYCVVDGICGDLSFEEGGNPVVSNRIIAGRNPLTVDSFCAELIGRRPNEIGYLSIGKELCLGDFFASETELVELNVKNKPLASEIKGTAADKYEGIINEDCACSACLSALIYALERVKCSSGVYGEKLSIGQGFLGKCGEGTGIGNCTDGFTRFVPGCPPKATAIIEALL